MNKRFLVFLSAALVFLLAACNPSAPATGTLQVNISGLPAGANASVNVSGAGFSQDLTATTTLSGRALGSYTVTAANVSSGGVTFVGTVSGSPATVSANATATVTVTYAVNPASLGSLQVLISGVPAESNAAVSVTGPNGFSQNLVRSETINGLVPGAYTVTANNTPGGGTTANFTLGGTVTGSPATVTAGVTATANVAYAPINGALTVTVAGLPASTNANVVVTGPNSFTQTLTATTTIPNLAPGTYTITTNAVRAPGTIVDAIFDGFAPATNVVGVGVTAVRNSTYNIRGGTGAMWIPVNGQISGYGATQLAASGNVVPGGTAAKAGNNESIVFDKNGVAYVLNSSNNLISIFGKFPQGNTNATATIVGAATGLNTPFGMAFDSSGNLWVTNTATAGTATGDSVVSFSAATLAGLVAGNNNVAPAVTLTSTSFLDPVGLAFDSGGNLWVSNTTNNPAFALVRLAPNQLGTSAAVTPAGSVQGGLNSPAGLAFDSAGSLWVANFGGNNILKFTAQQLNTGGSQTATVTLSGFAKPAGVAFDNAGNLWLTLVAGALDQIAAASLGASGSPTPAVTITGFGSTDFGGLAFSLTPSNLPIQNK